MQPIQYPGDDETECYHPSMSFLFPSDSQILRVLRDVNVLGISRQAQMQLCQPQNAVTKQPRRPPKRAQVKDILKNRQNVSCCQFLLLMHVQRFAALYAAKKITQLIAVSDRTALQTQLRPALPH